MAYNKNYSFDGFGNNYPRAPYSYNQKNYVRSQPKKRTGAKSGLGKGGKLYVTGWNASKQHGLVSFIASAYSGTGVHESRQGREWENWVCKVSPKFQKPYLISCLYDKSTGKVIIPDMGFVINPRTNYCGRFGKKK